MADAEGDGESHGVWTRLAELESRSIQLQREVQDSRGAAAEAEATLKAAKRDADALHKVPDIV